MRLKRRTPEISMSFANNSRLSRRHVLQAGLLAGIGAALPGSLPAAENNLSVISKAIPSTGQKLPVIGIGTNQFGRTDYNVVRDMLKRMYELGGTVIDTAALYDESEVQIGKALGELGLSQKIFIATKFNAASPRDPIGGKESIERSMARLQKVDLMFIHFLDSVEPLMPVLQDLKKQGRVRYIGITNVNNQRENPRLAEYLGKYPLDFVQVEYSLGNRAVEQQILPLAQERKLAVMAAVPLGGGRNLLLNKVGDRQLPKWAAEFGIASWSQFFLKYVVSHPAITCAIPGSSKVEHLEDNLAAAHGRLPDAATRKRMEEFWEGRA
jgi:aryl-alcohol dehydrogenase-like predicted oxidoreductase